MATPTSIKLDDALKGRMQHLADMARLHRWLFPKDADGAKRAVAAIREGVKILAATPHIGCPAEAMDPGYRGRLIAFGNSGSIILYHPDGDIMALLAVCH